jgi:hypothetical protein
MEAATKAYTNKTLKMIELTKTKVLYMKIDFKAEKLEGKSLAQLEAIIKKYRQKIIRLDFIKQELKEFNVPISVVTESFLSDRIKLYEDQIRKVIKEKTKRILEKANLDD